MAYYNYSKSYLEDRLAEFKELLSIEKELDKLSKENKLANNYDLYMQYMWQIQRYHFDDSIEYAKIFANTKEELIEKARKFVKELNYFNDECYDEDELSEYEKVMQEAYIGFIGQGYYDIYYFCGEDLCVYRIDEMLRIILDDAKVRFEFDDEVWEYICEHLDDDMY